MISIAKCSDFGSPFCPCILAESGRCPVCNVARGDDFCDCHTDAGFCVYQELVRNGGRARQPRQSISCQITKVLRFAGVVFIRFRVPLEMESELKKPGSFVFIRNDENPLFDLPVSIQYDENYVGTVGASIIINGPKTFRFRDIAEGDSIMVKGPYFNGLTGLGNIFSCRNEDCLVIAKGIGLLPSVSTICHLKSRGNNVKILVDPGEFPLDLTDFHLSLFELEAERCRIVSSDSLSEEFKDSLLKFIVAGGRFIHIGASDYVITLITSFLRQIGRTDIRLSSSNNAKMCCGDGICGACTENVPGRSSVHFCKEQVDVWDIDIKKMAKYR